MYSIDEFGAMHEAGEKAIKMMSQETRFKHRHSDLWNGEFILNLALQGYRVAYIEESWMDSRYPNYLMWVDGNIFIVFIVPLDLVLAYEQNLYTKEFINF